jgi:cell wall-associated NlpC family hydrolase
MKFKKNILISLLVSIITIANVNAEECNYQQSVSSDFSYRDSLPQYSNSNYRDSWGPRPARFPAPQIPSACDSVKWQQQRIVAVAEKYIGLPYKHHHIPGFDNGNGAGLDCSNFTSWVYNYGLGIKINSDITKQADTAGRMLAPDEALQPGDLLFIRTVDDSRISHVVIYIDSGHIIDDHASGVKIREFKGWYKNHFAYARRIIN